MSKPNPAVEPIQILEPPSTDCGALIKSAESSFLLIERWNDTTFVKNIIYHSRLLISFLDRSEDPFLVDLIAQVQVLGMAYLDSLKLSVQVAQRSLDISRDAISVIRSILADDPVEEIAEFVIDMKKKVRVVYKGTKNVSNRFHRIGKGLDKVCHCASLIVHLD